MNALDKAREVRLERSAAGIKIEVLDPIEKARQNPHSLRRAINGKCYDCIGRNADPNWRKSIRECIVVDCSLWNVRPYQTEPDES